MAGIYDKKPGFVPDMLYISSVIIGENAFLPNKTRRRVGGE